MKDLLQRKGLAEGDDDDLANNSYKKITYSVCRESSVPIMPVHPYQAIKDDR